MNDFTVLDLLDKNNDILLIGEILIDKIKSNNNIDFSRSFGGSPANIAVNLKSLGLKPVFFGTVGDDESGSYLKKQLQNKGINTDNLEIVNKDTSSVTIENPINPDPQFNRESDYYIEYTKELEKAMLDVKLIHFSYWPLSKEPSKSTILKVIDFAKENNILIGFDPNYHIDLQSNESIDLNELKEIIGKVDIIKPSLDDSKRIFGEGFTTHQYLKKFQELGCKIIFMTLGEDGIIANYDNQIIELPSLAKDIVDVTGAGDAFWSGLYSGIINKETILNSINIGLICSAHNLKHNGAISNLPNFFDLKKEYGI